MSQHNQYPKSSKWPLYLADFLLTLTKKSEFLKVLGGMRLEKSSISIFVNYLTFIRPSSWQLNKSNFVDNNVQQIHSRIKKAHVNLMRSILLRNVCYYVEIRKIFHIIVTPLLKLLNVFIENCRQGKYLLFRYPEDDPINILFIKI